MIKIHVITIRAGMTTFYAPSISVTGIYYSDIAKIVETSPEYDLQGAVVVDYSKVSDTEGGETRLIDEVVFGPTLNLSVGLRLIVGIWGGPEPIEARTPNEFNTVGFDIWLGRQMQIPGVVVGKVEGRQLVKDESLKAMVETLPETALSIRKRDLTPTRLEFGHWSFQEAQEWYLFASTMGDALPDGQWPELRALVEAFRNSYGQDMTAWNETVQKAFTVEVQENYLQWI